MYLTDHLANQNDAVAVLRVLEVAAEVSAERGWLAPPAAKPV